MPSQDPRSYVKTAPLPISSHKGLKLQARSAVVFNPTTPTRKEVRKWNYDRRTQQMADQGFNACNYKPYKGLGDPFYLDEKKLILHSLGQYDETEDMEPSSSSEEDEEPETSAAVAAPAALTTAKFVLKRTRKDLNTLSKEVVKGRQLIRNVSLGHGLFDLIKQERQAKKAALFAEKKRSLEEARNQWQPPKVSSDEESDDEDLENHFGDSFLDNLSDDFDMARTSATSPSDYRPKTSSTKTHSSGKHKKLVTPRPFTPQYNNLLEISEHTEDISRDIGGSKISAKKAREEKRAETDWERWLNNQQIGRVNKKGSITRLNRLSRASRLLSNPRMSFQSRSISPSSSSSQVLSAPQTTSLPFPSQINSIANQAPVLSHKETVIESRAVTPIEEAEEETLHRTGIFKFLDEYYDSLRREEERKKVVGAETANPQDDPNQQASAEDQQIVKRHHEGRSAKKSKSSQDKQQSPDRLSKSPEARPRSKFILQDLRNNFNRSKSSTELIEFHANKASSKYANLRQDLHNKFKEIHDDKAMTLHDVLEQMERVRLAKCQTKFRSLRTQSVGFFRAVREMRREEHRVLTQPEMIGRRSSIKGNWYTDLLLNLPDEVKDIWYYQIIMQKIGKYGLVENTSKQSVYKFLKVLEGLRHWEICSPDISAAIEFCRSRIVEMSVEEYEEWFSQAFPKILRPKTAPAAFRDHQQAETPKHGLNSPDKDGTNVKNRGHSKGKTTQKGAHSQRATSAVT